jgi:FMN reductase [NAD(P)H]
VDFAEVMRRRRMVRNYTDEPVSREALERIARAGRRAPSGGFSQGVRVVIVTDPET